MFEANSWHLNSMFLKQITHITLSKSHWIIANVNLKWCPEIIQSYNTIFKRQSNAAASKISGGASWKLHQKTCFLVVAASDGASVLSNISATYRRRFWREIEEKRSDDVQERRNTCLLESQLSLAWIEVALDWMMIWSLDPGVIHLDDDHGRENGIGSDGCYENWVFLMKNLNDDHVLISKVSNKKTLHNQQWQPSWARADANDQDLSRFQEQFKSPKLKKVKHKKNHGLNIKKIHANSGFGGHFSKIILDYLRDNHLWDQQNDPWSLWMAVVQNHALVLLHSLVLHRRNDCHR